MSSSGGLLGELASLGTLPKWSIQFKQAINEKKWVLLWLIYLISWLDFLK